jgi:lysophospholipase L1-like esterase
MMPPRRTSLRRWTRRVGIALAALLVLGMAGEVVLHLAPRTGGARNIIRTQLNAGPGRFASDPELGAVLAPFRHDVVRTPDYTYTVETDHAGFSNPDPWPSRVDVAVLGNSLLDGPGVGMDGEFTTLLEDRLDGRSVLSLGLPGGGTGHELLIYRRFAEPLHPRLVIAMLWIIWDIDNTQQFEHWQRESKPDPDYTHYRFTYNETHPSGTPAALSTFERVWHFARRQLGKSYLIKAGYQNLTSLLGRQAIREQVTFPNGETIFLSISDQHRLAKGMDRPSTPDIREVFFRPLEQLRTEVEATGGRFLIVLVPSKEELYGADTFPAILRPVQEVRAGLEARQLPVLDLYPTFHELGRQRPPFYRADMHLNALGNQIVADALATWIANQKIFTAPPSAPAVAVVAPAVPTATPAVTSAEPVAAVAAPAATAATAATPDALDQKVGSFPSADSD